MGSKLENLVNNLVEPHKKLSIDMLKQRFPNIDYAMIILINLNYY